MSGLLKSLLKPPEPAGHPIQLRTFTTKDAKAQRTRRLESFASSLLRAFAFKLGRLARLVVRIARTKTALASRPGAGWYLCMVRSNMDNIPQVPFPEGFGIRAMRPAEADLWTDVQRDAEPYSRITDELFFDQFGSDLPATEQRCYFVTNREGAVVGTISAWYDRNFKGKDHGRIHWLAIRPAYQRRGLGKAALSYAMNRLAEWHGQCYLDTATARLPAIKMYLDFGFVPDLACPNAVEAWREVRAALDHPALDRMDL